MNVAFGVEGKKIHFCLYGIQKKWKWENLSEAVVEANQTGKYLDNLSCTSNQSIKKGDRAFLVKLGETPRRIVGSDFVVSDVFKAPYWD